MAELNSSKIKYSYEQKIKNNSIREEGMYVVRSGKNLIISSN